MVENNNEDFEYITEKYLLNKLKDRKGSDLFSDA